MDSGVLATLSGWRTAGWVALYVLAALALSGGVDCIVLGIRDLRKAGREYDRRVALLTGATGIGLLLIGGLLWWAGMSVRLPTT